MSISNPIKKEYQLAGGPKLIVQKGSMTDWPDEQHKRGVDMLTPLAVVNAANQRLHPGGGVDGMIHGKAGPALSEECRRKPEVRPGIRCPTGEAVETKGYNFKTDFIIHTTGPVYAVERRDECERDLGNAYRNSMLKAQELGVRCVAFPAISTGVYAYPFKEAAQVSLQVLKDAKPPLEEVWVVLWAQPDFDTFTGLAEKMGLPPWTSPAKPRATTPPPAAQALPPQPPLAAFNSQASLTAEFRALSWTTPSSEASQGDLLPRPPGNDLSRFNGDLPRLAGK